MTNQITLFDGLPADMPETSVSATLRELGDYCHRMAERTENR